MLEVNTHLVKEIETLKIQNYALVKQSNVEKKDVGVNTNVEESADEVLLEHSLVEEDSQRRDESLLEGQGESSVLSSDFPKLMRMKSVQERAITALRRWFSLVILIYLSSALRGQNRSMRKTPTSVKEFISWSLWWTSW